MNNNKIKFTIIKQQDVSRKRKNKITKILK